MVVSLDIVGLYGLNLKAGKALQHLWDYPLEAHGCSVSRLVYAI